MVLRTTSLIIITNVQSNLSKGCIATPRSGECVRLPCVLGSHMRWRQQATMYNPLVRRHVTISTQVPSKHPLPEGDLDLHLIIHGSSSPCVFVFVDVQSSVVMVPVFALLVGFVKPIDQLNI